MASCNTSAKTRADVLYHLRLHSDRRPGSAFIQQFDPARWRKPKDASAPLIDSITFHHGAEMRLSSRQKNKFCSVAGLRLLFSASQNSGHDAGVSAAVNNL
jgi:hypothetical protein